MDENKVISDYKSAYENLLVKYNCLADRYSIKCSQELDNREIMAELDILRRENEELRNKIPYHVRCLMKILGIEELTPSIIEVLRENSCNDEH